MVATAANASETMLNAAATPSMAQDQDQEMLDAEASGAAQSTEEDDSHLPLSSSSAMPDLNAATVPRLKARVHSYLNSPEVANLPLSKVQFRPLRSEDLDEMMALHKEWFPVAYDQPFYEKSVQGELLSLVATYSPSCEESAGENSSSGLEQTPNECILGMITMSTFCEHHSEDIKHVLGGDCEVMCTHKPSGATSSSVSGPTVANSNRSPMNESDAIKAAKALAEEGKSQGAVAYILTLGVADGFRRRGLAKELLRQSILHVEQHMLHVKAVYLHVVTYNDAAVKLYESMGFQRIEHFPAFYVLHGSNYDSFLYALYLHGGSPPWKWKLRHAWSKGVASTLSEVASTSWSALTPLWKGGGNSKLAARST
eukprot:TRINITY_DN27971_c0_g1_i1.p1 TRINITY_DN27971_c0_g1~~TRINITY_DN27971_c0_g1_i1.p1  ORF type:complete len:370 (+),score=65.19 TRINITY_DN27971_c0_g1_i1:77-1186(+)